MTIPEFLERLRKTEGPWALDDEGQIRCAEGRCPVCAVEGSRRWWSDNIAAAAAMGLAYSESYAIAYAADSSDDSQDLRRQLLAATVERVS